MGHARIILSPDSKSPYWTWQSDNGFFWYDNNIDRYYEKNLFSRITDNSGLGYARIVLRPDSEFSH